ncbi:hypothetical protein B0H16DRAFT_1481364, partial [Mycena metata]
QLQLDDLAEHLQEFNASSLRLDLSDGTNFMWDATDATAVPTDVPSIAAPQPAAPQRPQPRAAYRGAAFTPHRGGDDVETPTRADVFAPRHGDADSPTRDDLFTPRSGDANSPADDDFIDDFGQITDFRYAGPLAYTGPINLTGNDAMHTGAFDFQAANVPQLLEAPFQLRPLSADSEATNLLTTFVYQATAPPPSSASRSSPVAPPIALRMPVAPSRSLVQMVQTATISRTPGMTGERGMPAPMPSPLRQVHTAGEAGSGVHAPTTTPSPLRQVTTAEAGVEGRTVATATTSTAVRVLLTPDDFPESRPMSNAPLALKSATGKRGGGSGRAVGRGRGGGMRGGRVAASPGERSTVVPSQPNTVERVDPARMRQIRAMEKQRDEAAARVAAKRRNPDGHHDLVVLPPPPPGHEPLPNGPAALGGGRVRRAPQNRDDFVYEAPKKQTLAEIRAAAAAKKQAKEVVGMKRKSAAENENPAAEKRITHKLSELPQSLANEQTQTKSWFFMGKWQGAGGGWAGGRAGRRAGGGQAGGQRAGGQRAGGKQRSMRSRAVASRVWNP